MANGELNAKYPGGIEAQKEMLENDGQTVTEEKTHTTVEKAVETIEKIYGKCEDIQLFSGMGADFSNVSVFVQITNMRFGITM